VLPQDTTGCELICWLHSATPGSHAQLALLAEC